MHILHPFWDRFLNDFGSILAPKMEPKLIPNFMFSGRVSWYSFLMFVKGVFWKFNMFSHHAMTLFLIKTKMCFYVCLWSCILQDQLKERSQTLQKTNPKLSKHRWKNVPKTIPKSIFFWTPFGDAWRPRFWAGFGVDLGSMLGPFWG